MKQVDRDTQVVEVEEVPLHTPSTMARQSRAGSMAGDTTAIPGDPTI